MYDITKTLFYRKPCAPCKGCPDRHVECHGSCKKYADWSKEEKEINKNIRAAKDDENMKSEHEIKLHIERKDRFLR